MQRVRFSKINTHQNGLLPDGAERGVEAWTPPLPFEFPALFLHLLYWSLSAQRGRELWAAVQGLLRNEEQDKRYFQLTRLMLILHNIQQFLN